MSEPPKGSVFEASCRRYAVVVASEFDSESDRLGAIIVDCAKSEIGIHMLNWQSTVMHLC